LWPHSLKVAQLLRSAACLHTNQSRSYLNHLVLKTLTAAKLVKKKINLLETVKHNKYIDPELQGVFHKIL